MNYKIIETGYELPDVLLHRDRNDDGEEIVQIKAIGFYDGADNMFCIEDITFNSECSAQRFIKDFTLESAESWCTDNQIKYSENHK